MLYIYFDNLTFYDIVQGLVECLNHHGIKVEVTNQIKDDTHLDLYIIFGMNDFVGQKIPDHYIVYQLEQTTGNNESKWFTDRYITYLKNACAVWDYSLINYQNLKKLGIERIYYFPLQYMRAIDQKTDTIGTEPKYDILFYGSLNQRRQSIIDQLKNHGFNALIKTHLWNQERLDTLRQVKIILNIHFFEQSILETARLSYLLSNDLFVVSECSCDPILDHWHAPYVTLINRDQLVDQCKTILSRFSEFKQQRIKNLQEYKKHPYGENLPLKSLEPYKCLFQYQQEPILPLLSTQSTQSTQSPLAIPPPIISSSDLFTPEIEITANRELILKLPHLEECELPNVSIITITRNRAHLYPIAIRNWLLFEYPRDKMEWIIIDDSDNDRLLTELIPASPQIKYHHFSPSEHLTIGQKRNLGVEYAQSDYIVMMDDDDYYYPCSIYARIALLLKYPKYEIVGVTDLDIYDTVHDFSGRIKSPHLSEASMAFKKSFWKEQPFPIEANSLGEGYPFTRHRRDRIIKMPSCFNLIAITHSENYTLQNRSYCKFKMTEKKDNILDILDDETRTFIVQIYNLKTRSTSVNTQICK
ncbi:MAG: glycosyltransferase [candidate division WOR-3 bacterium]